MQIFEIYEELLEFVIGIFYCKLLILALFKIAEFTNKLSWAGTH